MSEDLPTSIDAAPLGRAPGIVYTFYSYKGGVGRSMALASVGVMLASAGHKVLLVDWDLEAPGLEAYFRRGTALRGDPAQLGGVIDLLDAHAGGPPLRWQECLLKADFIGHSLDIITAGRRDDDYRQRVQQLNWESLFREHQIGNFVDHLRGEWRAAYDYVLVDSRTGITDIGDICTVLLPDVLVLLFVTNYQNIEGIKSVMARAVRARTKLPIQRSKLIGVPVPARDERDRESEKFKMWHQIFAEEFGGLYRDWLPKGVEPQDALLRLFIPYIATWSFGEAIPVLESPRDRVDPTSLGVAYARLATLLEYRLDWAALDSQASMSDLRATQLESSSLRTAAREAEVAQRRAEEELRASQFALEAARPKALSERKMRRRWAVVVATTMLAPLAAVVQSAWWATSNNLPFQYVLLQPFWYLGWAPKVPETVPIPPWRFTMGCKPGRDIEVGGDCRKQGLPEAKEVELPEPCAMGKTTVTFLQYDHYVWSERGKGIYSPTFPRDVGFGRFDRPVINVNWNEAKAYAEWLSKRMGVLYRLPSEAEWEYAARGGKEGRFPWGDDPPAGKANCAECDDAFSGKGTAPVGTYPPNGYGLHDMAGNVYQWVEDKTGKDEASRVLRGGSWGGNARSLRAADRDGYHPDDRGDFVGFRVCRASPIEKPVAGVLNAEPPAR